MAPALSLKQQERLVRYHFPRVEVWRRVVDGLVHLCFRLKLKPTPTSDTYSVLFAYALGTRPLVGVLEPRPLKWVDGKPTPHLNRDSSLCLYDSACAEWTPADALVHTTVQWTLRWLFHYEHWIIFGEWRGDAAPTTAVLKTPEAAVTLAEVL